MKKLMAANWKMYKTRSEAVDMLSEFRNMLGSLPDDREVLFFAPFTALGEASTALEGSEIMLGGQDVYPALEGAYTGEISPLMLKDCGCKFALTGHSERRHIIGENDELIGKKTSFALAEGLDVVLCIGETLEQRKNGHLLDVLKRQLTSGLEGVPNNIAPERISIAYEPVWAIGTGEVAAAGEIVEAQAAVRNFLREIFTENAMEMRILYGGSVKPENAGEIIKLDNVDGVLVGGASLQAKNFSKIVLA